MPLSLVPLFFAFTLFVSALLLFLVEPMIAKMVLPCLGGTPAVWNTCMVFFQGLLLAGYGYAHVSTKYLGVRRQAALHIGLMALTLLVLFAVPLTYIRGFSPPGDVNPVPYLLAALLLTVGLPFFVVSASAPLLQKWFASTGHPSAKDPYFLYAASNLGSMIALLAYPLVVEPVFKLREQSEAWQVGFALLLFITLGCAFMVWQARDVPMIKPSGKRKGGDKKGPGKSEPEVHIRPGSPQSGRRDKGGPAKPEPEVAAPPSLAMRLYWIALSIVPSSLMLGVTTYITMDIAAIPLLWVIPLSLYLLSFIIVFSKMPPWLDKLIFILFIACIVALIRSCLPSAEGADTKGLAGIAVVLRAILPILLLPLPVLLWPKVPPLLHRAMIIALPLLILVLTLNMTSGWRLGLGQMGLIIVHLLTLFVVAMVCHGELARTRPAPEYLTEYFLLMSFGGVLGGMFNALVAPLIFTQIAEYPLAMVVACMLLPNLAPEENTSAATFWTDVILAVAPAVLASVLIFVALRSGESDLTAEKIRGTLGSDMVRFYLLVGVASAATVAYVFHKTEDWPNRLFDVIAAISVGLLFIGLSEGLTAGKFRFERLAEFFHAREPLFRRVLIYLLPLLLLFTLLARPVRFGLGVGALLLASSFSDALDSRILYRDRSFFGVLNVKYFPAMHDEDVNDIVPESHQLVHGTTLHGKQFLDPARNREALTYYHKTGPIGQVFDSFMAKDSPKKLEDIALIGLGTGTLTSYAEPGMHVTVYDIDKAVVHIARDTGYFTYFNDTAERIGEKNLNIVLGDARLRIADAKDVQYDLIAVDAFSSDAIPIHLITKEALDLYRKKLKPTGIVAFHISNRYLDLEPVVANVAASLGMEAIVRNDRAENYPGKSSSTWVLVVNKMDDFGKIKDDIHSEKDDGKHWDLLPQDKTKGVWTDDYSNIVSVFMELDKAKAWWKNLWGGKKKTKTDDT